MEEKAWPKHRAFRHNRINAHKLRLFSLIIDIMNDYGMEQLVHFPTRERNTLDLFITSIRGQFVDIHSPDRLSDHDIVSGTLKVVIHLIKKPKREVYQYQKGDYESTRNDTLKFAKER